MNEITEILEKKKKQLREFEKNKEEIAKIFRNIKDFEFGLENIYNERIINNVSKFNQKTYLGAIDGGIGLKSLHGIDLVILRVAKVSAFFDGKKLTYNTIDVNKPNILFFESGEEGEFLLFASLNRMLSEIKTAKKLIEDEILDYLLLDGPIYPHPSILAAKNSKLKDLYKNVIEAYDSLIKKAKEVNTEVIGVVEDSRSKYLCNVLKKEILPSINIEKNIIDNLESFRDTVILDSVLNEGERTFTFKISKINDIYYGDEIFSFYIKSSKRDRPIRIEFVGRENLEKRIEKIASLVYSLSGFESYSIPTPIIVADQKAKINENFMNYLLKLLDIDKFSISSSLRRERRPF